MVCNVLSYKPEGKWNDDANLVIGHFGESGYPRFRGLGAFNRGRTLTQAIFTQTLCVCWHRVRCVVCGFVLLSRSQRLSFTCVLLSRSRRLSFPCAGVVLATLVLRKIAIVLKRSEGVRGSWGKNEQKKSRRVRIRFMEQRSGRVKFARSQMCGRGGDAGDATVTYQRGCMGSTGRQLPQGQENGVRALRRRVVKKTGGPKVWRQKTRSFGPGLAPWRRREETEPEEGPGEKVDWRKRRMDMRQTKSWIG